MSTESDRAAALEHLLSDIDTLPVSEVWKIRIFAGLRRVVHERCLRGAGLAALLAEESGPSAAIFALLDARTLAVLGTSSSGWHAMPSWSEHWFVLGKQDFGKQRRLVPAGRFEGFDDAVLDPAVDWRRRYGNFVRAAHCRDIGSLRLAAVRVAQSLDLEMSCVEEIRRRLVIELKLGDQNFLSLECVEQLLEDASTIRSAGGRPDELGPGVETEPDSRPIA